MKKIESFVFGKDKNQNKCEDIVFLNNHFAAIIDGATTKSEYDFNGVSTGKMAALLIEDALKTLDKKATKEETEKVLTKSINDFYKKENYLTKIEEDEKNKCTASVIIFSFYHYEIWQFGDCHCLVDGVYYESNKLIDYICHNTRSIVIGALLKKGFKESDILTNDPAREAIEPILNNQQYYQNIPLKESEFGYVCFDGFSVPTEDVPVIKVPKNTKKIVLASDGYPKLYDTLKETEDYLEKIKKIDPLCYKENKSTKGFNFDLNSFDDRSYLSISLEKNT